MTTDIAVSFSRSITTDPRDHKHFFVAHGPFQNIEKFVTKRPWSPIVWRDGTREKANFESSSVVALDFDSGEWTIENAKDWLAGTRLSGIIATTKSHAQEKRSGSKVLPPCDRFRLILAAKTTTSLDDFEYTMGTYLESLPCDKSCKDGARFYFPCTEIVHAHFEGGSAGWLACPYHETEEGKALARRPIAPDEMRNLGSVPNYIWGYIAYGVKDERHKTAYIVACELAKRGFDADEIMAILVKHNSPLLHIGEGKDHVSRCIGNGIKRVWSGSYGLHAVANDGKERT